MHDPVSLLLFSFSLSSYLTKHDTWNTRLSLQSHRTKSRQMACELSLSQYLGGMYQSPALCDIWSSVIAPRPWGTDEWWRDGGMTFKDWQIEWQRFEYLIICSFFTQLRGVHTQCHSEWEPFNALFSSSQWHFCQWWTFQNHGFIQQYIC